MDALNVLEEASRLFLKGEERGAGQTPPCEKRREIQYEKVPANAKIAL